MFPSTLLGTGEKWTLMKSISVTEYLNYEAGILMQDNKLLRGKLCVANKRRIKQRDRT
jgi:hypothetical protein